MRRVADSASAGHGGQAETTWMQRPGVEPDPVVDASDLNAIRLHVDGDENPSGGVAIPRSDRPRFIIADLDQSNWVRRCPTLAR